MANIRGRNEDINQKQMDLSKAASILRDPNASQDEKHKAAQIMGSHSHKSSQSYKEDEGSSRGRSSSSSASDAASKLHRKGVSPEEKSEAAKNLGSQSHKSQRTQKNEGRGEDYDESEDNSEADLSGAGKILRDPNASADEKHKAAQAMGSKGGSLSHGGGRPPKTQH